MRPHDITVRTKLSRDQQRYCEEQGYLGPVARSGSERDYSPAQVHFFESLAALRASGLNHKEAAAVAAEAAGGPVPKLDHQRLEALFNRSMIEVERSLHAFQVLWRLARVRGTTTNGSTPPDDSGGQ